MACTVCMAIKAAARLAVPSREALDVLLHAPTLLFWQNVDRVFRSWAQERSIRRDVTRYLQVHPEIDKTVDEVMADLRKAAGAT